MEQIVVPENPIGIEIIELVVVGFSGHVLDVALVPAVISRVLPESGRCSNGDPRLATPDRCAATPESQAETETSRSTFPGRAISMLVAMAFGTLDRQTGYCYRLAPPRFPFVLDLEGSTWSTGSAACFKRDTRVDSNSKPRQRRMGSAQNP